MTAFSANSTIQRQAPLIYKIDFAKSLRILEDKIEQYNATANTRNKVKAVHRSLAEKLIRLFRNRFFAWQAHNGFTFSPTLSPLPLLEANNQFLAEIMTCTDRTIRNYRERLEALGLITQTVWHGSNAAFELSLNVDFLYVCTNRDSALVPAMQSFPHTSSGYIPEPLPELVPVLVSGNLSLQPEQPEPPVTLNAVVKPELPAQPEPEYRNETSRPHTGTAPPVAPTPPRAEHVRAARALASWALPMLYPGVKFSADDQVKTEAAIGQLFAPVVPAKIKLVMENYAYRCQIISALWTIKTGTPLPPPHEFFDQNNLEGFRSTRHWSFDEEVKESPTPVAPPVFRTTQRNNIGPVQIGNLFNLNKQ